MFVVGSYRQEDPGAGGANESSAQARADPRAAAGGQVLDSVCPVHCLRHPDCWGRLRNPRSGRHRRAAPVNLVDRCWRPSCATRSQKDNMLPILSQPVPAPTGAISSESAHPALAGTGGVHSTPSAPHTVLRLAADALVDLTDSPPPAGQRADGQPALPQRKAARSADVLNKDLFGHEDEDTALYGGAARLKRRKLPAIARAAEQRGEAAPGGSDANKAGVAADADVAKDGEEVAAEGEAEDVMNFTVFCEDYVKHREGGVEAGDQQEHTVLEEMQLPRTFDALYSATVCDRASRGPPSWWGLAAYIVAALCKLLARFSLHCFII